MALPVRGLRPFRAARAADDEGAEAADGDAPALLSDVEHALDERVERPLGGDLRSRRRPSPSIATRSALVIAPSLVSDERDQVKGVTRRAQGTVAIRRRRAPPRSAARRAGRASRSPARASSSRNRQASGLAVSPVMNMKRSVSSAALGTRGAVERPRRSPSGMRKSDTIEVVARAAHALERRRGRPSATSTCQPAWRKSVTTRSSTSGSSSTTSAAAACPARRAGHRARAPGAAAAAARARAARA